jgi:hypothetical protein
MSLFQCDNCGVVENTACSLQGTQPMFDDFDWTGIENRKGKLLCSQCAPDKFLDGTDTELGVWHDEFPRTLLAMGMFKTNNRGNLEHIETGSTDFMLYKL